MKKLLFFGILALLALLSVHDVAAIEKPGEELKEVGLDTKLGTQVDLNLRFTAHDGREGALKDFVSGTRPIVLIPVYYSCPRLCGLLLNGALQLFNNLNLKMGSEYEVLSVSFNPDEKSPDAAKRSTEYKAKLSKPDADLSAWHFMTGTKENISVLMKQIGFKYFKDQDEYAHTAAIIILTPQGEISQYFTGIDFSGWDVRLSLIEASQGKVGSLIDHLLLFCFRYDHAEGKYTWAVFNLVRVVGAVTLAFVLSVVLWAARGRRNRRALRV